MREPETIDVSLDGRVLTAPGAPLSARLLGAAILLAAVAGAIGIAVLALWLALILIPVALAAACIAWLMWKWRAWQSQR